MDTQDVDKHWTQPRAQPWEQAGPWALTRTEHGSRQQRRLHSGSSLQARCASRAVGLACRQLRLTLVRAVCPPSPAQASPRVSEAGAAAPRAPSMGPPVSRARLCLLSGLLPAAHTRLATGPPTGSVAPPPPVHTAEGPWPHSLPQRCPPHALLVPPSAPWALPHQVRPGTEVRCLRCLTCPDPGAWQVPSRSAAHPLRAALPPGAGPRPLPSPHKPRPARCLQDQGPGPCPATSHPPGPQSGPQAASSRELCAGWLYIQLQRRLLWEAAGRSPASHMWKPTLLVHLTGPRPDSSGCDRLLPQLTRGAWEPGKLCAAGTRPSCRPGGSACRGQTAAQGSAGHCFSDSEVSLLQGHGSVLGGRSPVPQ